VADGLYLRARNIVKQLRPEVLDTLGLKGVVEEMVRQIDSLHFVQSKLSSTFMACVRSPASANARAESR